MASIVVAGDTSGTVTLAAPLVAGTTTLTLPTTNGTILTTGSSGQSIPRAALPTGSVLQVVSTSKTNSFTTSSSTWTDVTGLSVTITPTSATSKILVFLNGHFSVSSGGTGIYAKLVRGSTDILIADNPGSGITPTTMSASTSGTVSTRENYAMQINYLDSPATTSATTYKVQVGAYDGGTQIVNGVYNMSATGSSIPRSTSTITVMEIAA